MALTKFVSVLIIAVVTASFYLIPVGRADATGWSLAVAFAGGLVIVIWLIGRYVRAAQTTGARVGHLLALAYIAVVFFALAFYVLERAVPGQFEHLATRTDALYLAVTAVATVGFGDVHAVGQAARVLVTIQMLFNIVVLGVAVTVVRELPRRGAHPPRGG